MILQTVKRHNDILQQSEFWESEMYKIFGVIYDIFTNSLCVELYNFQRSNKFVTEHRIGL